VNVMATSQLEALEVHDNPLRSLGDVVAFSSADFSQERDRAWIYGIVLGWDCEDGNNPKHRHDEDCSAAMDEVATAHGWGPTQVARLRVLRAKFIEIDRALSEG
jgi:hypothetical protein